MQGKIKVHIWKTCLSAELEITDITYERDSKASVAFSCFLFLTEKKSSQEEFFCTFGWRFKVLPITKHIFRLQIDNVLNRPIQPCTTLTLYYTAVTGQHLQTHNA